MKQNTRVVTLLFVIALGVAGIAGVAGAQEDGGGIEIRTNATAETETYAQEVGPNTRIVEWEYNDEREGFRILYETDESTTVTITEAVQFSEGSGSGAIYRERLPEGATEVFVKVPRRGGNAAVTMVTPGSLEDNSFSYVSTGETTPDKPAITYERVQLLVGGTALGASGLVFGLVKKRREDEERDYERIL